MNRKKTRLLMVAGLVAVGGLALPMPAGADDPITDSTARPNVDDHRTVEREVLGFRIEFDAENELYRMLTTAAGDRKTPEEVLVTGPLETCEKDLLDALRQRHGTGKWNVPTVTTGGLQFWGDVFVFQDWRIQEHVYTGHYRLLDSGRVRRAWGSYEGCRVAFEEQRVAQKLRRKSDHLVLLLHGLGRSRHSFSAMHQKLTEAGYEVASVGYPSTRRSLAEHAAQLAGVLERTEGVRTVSFVTHSLGGIVVRKLLATPGRWRDSIKPERVVMLAPPNRGSVIADVLEDWVPFQVIAGEVGQELTPEALAELPAPACSFGVIAGGIGKAHGYNPVLVGDNDGVVLVDNARLPGTDDFLLVNASHSFIMCKTKVIEATIAFLKTGRFAASAD